MASKAVVSNPSDDFAEHQKTYQAFIKGTTIVATFIALLLAGMAIFLL